MVFCATRSNSVKFAGGVQAPAAASILPRMNVRLTAIFAIAMLVACGGSGPDADADKSPDEIRKAARDMSAEDIEKTVEEYRKAIDAAAGDSERKDLQEKMSIYGGVLAKKKLGGG